MTTRTAPIVLLAASTMLAACASHTQQPAPAAHTPMQTTGILFDQLPTGEKFAVYIPRAAPPESGWPAIVFLNGSGECGTDGQRQLTQGLLPAILNRPDDWPFIVIFPQKPTSQTLWAQHNSTVIAALNQSRSTHKIDSTRLYLTGLSQGGRGTWEIAAANPGLFAAIAPVCGFGIPDQTAPKLNSTPVWAFHGEKDDVVKPEQTRAMIHAIAAHRSQTPVALQRDDQTPSPLRITIYPDLNHGCWDRAYRDAGLHRWFLQFSTTQGSN